VAVVGTLLSMLVFLSLFGTFLTFYLPLWMTDNEASFASGIAASMANLQSGMQGQAQLGGPPILATPFTMSSDAVPLLSIPTTATFRFLPHSPGTAVSLSIPNFITPNTPYVQTLGGNLGTVLVTLPNRYYTPVSFELENGAVIQSAGDTNQLVAFPPVFSLVKTGSAVSLTIELVQMYGNATSVTSPGTIEVYSQLFGNSQTLQSSSTGTVASLYLNVTTHYPCAWTTFFTQSQHNANVSGSQMTVLSLDNPVCVSANGQSQTVYVTLSNLTQVTVILATFQLSAGIGVI
jgi:hypothetical protein